jgi:hypothetical protein
VRNIPIFGDKASVPSHVGGLELGEVEGFGDPRLGVSFRYYGDTVKATTYLYNLGLENIPSDLRSGEVRAFFDQAYQDVVRAEEFGFYLDLELSEPQLLYLPDDAEPFCLWGKVRLPSRPWVWRRVHREVRFPSGPADGLRVHQQGEITPVPKTKQARTMALRDSSRSWWSGRHSSTRFATSANCSRS